MWINVIDYRGDNTVINNKGNTLYEKRTEIFLKQQADFAIWKQHGHKFRCFTQHNDNQYQEFDDVVYINRGNASESRNQVLDYYPQGSWISIWDNDATLYFDKLASRKFIEDLDTVIIPLADKYNFSGFIPYNPQQAPYPKPAQPPYTFKYKIEQKTTMLWLKVTEHRYDTSLTILEDWEYAFRMAIEGHIFAQSQDISLKEYALSVSTIFDNNKQGGKYEERKRQYAIAKQQVQDKLTMRMEEIRKLHRANYQRLTTMNNYEKLFVEENK